MATGESRCEERLINRSISLLFYDKTPDKFRRKSFFSYGFLNNEVESTRNNNEIRFGIEVEPLPKQFERIRWHSYIWKISEHKAATGLEMVKENEEFKRYGSRVC